MVATDQAVDREEAGGEVGSAGSDELEAKTQANPHHTRRDDGRRSRRHRI